MRSTGTRAFVRLDDRFYAVDAPFVARLREGLGAQPRAGLRALGFDPRRWLRDPRVAGTEQIAGVDTTRIGGKIDVARLLEDLDSLLTKAGGSAAGGGLLTPALRRQIAAAVDSAGGDVWTGTADKRVRQLRALIKFSFKANGGVSPIRGLDGGTIDLRLRLADVNETSVDVRAPEGAPPLSRLTGRSIEDFVTGIRTVLSGANSDGLIGPALDCITGSGGETAPFVRCISKLAPVGRALLRVRRAGAVRPNLSVPVPCWRMRAPSHTAIGTWSGGRYLHFGEAIDEARLEALVTPGGGLDTAADGRRLRRRRGRPAARPRPARNRARRRLRDRRDRARLLRGRARGREGLPALHRPAPARPGRSTPTMSGWRPSAASSASASTRSTSCCCTTPTAPATRARSSGRRCGRCATTA